MTDMSMLPLAKPGKVKKAKKKRPKTEREKLMEELDNLSKDVVRLRDGNLCQKCQGWCEGSNRHVSHVIPVSAGSRLRWEPLNMKILDYHHHINWWHKNPMESAKWFAETFPKRWAYLQEQKALGLKKFTLTELEAIKADLQQQLSGGKP